MTIFSGKDAKVYLGTTEIAKVASISFEEQRKRFTIETYQGKLKNYISKPLISGSIEQWDIGTDFLWFVFPYKEVETATDKLVGLFPEDSQFSVGHYDFITTTTTEVYNGQYKDQLLDLPSSLIGSSEEFTFGQIAVWVGGDGTPNSATYQISLYEDTTLRASDTFTWTSNTPHWEYFDANYTGSAVADWKVRLYTADAGTSSGTSLEWYITNSVTSPYLSGANSQVLNVNIEDWKVTEQTYTLKVDVTSGYTAYLYGVTFGNVVKGYDAGTISSYEIPFLADKVKWYQV